MKRSLVLSLVLALAATLVDRVAVAAVNLVKNDTITFANSDSASEGWGGAFDWTVTTVVTPTAASSAPGTTFQSFCVQLQQDIAPGGTYFVSNVLTNLKIGSTLNSSGSTLNSTAGLYLFDLWSENVNTFAHTAANAGMVQIALWLGEGYTESQIVNGAGYTSNSQDTGTFDVADAAIKSWESNPTVYTLLDGSVYGQNWVPPSNIDAIELNNLCGTGAQGQLVYSPILSGGNQPSDNFPVPEPVAVVIWGVGAVLAGAAALRRRKQPRGRWSEENRQAILQIIDSKG